MNYKNMKRMIALAGMAWILTIGMNAQTIVKPSVKTKTTFAIVTDTKSYEEAKEEIDAYRTSVEKEGLGTYLIVDDWKTPQPIRELLIQLHANKKAPLEGCVFVGDIPIPMLRDFATPIFDLFLISLILSSSALILCRISYVISVEQSSTITISKEESV